MAVQNQRSSTQEQQQKPKQHSTPAQQQYQFKTKEDNGATARATASTSTTTPNFSKSHQKKNSNTTPTTTAIAKGAKEPNMPTQAAHTQAMNGSVASAATTNGAIPAPAGGGNGVAAAAGGAGGGGGGPRVSFNRDVHVKRIGKRPNELTHYETTNIQPPQNHSLPSAYHHQLPDDLSAESIRKEAALVLAQAERHKSKAENGDNIPTFRVKSKRSGGGDTPKKFNSLPTRKKKSGGKPVTRSVSDAASKKPAKRPSIFSIFSRRSDSNLTQAVQTPAAVERDPRFEESGGRRLVRSKSDVGSYKEGERKLKKALKDPRPTANSLAPNSGGSTKQLHSHTPLSPIIENAQKEDYFAEQFNRERRKSEAITDREKHESGVSELLERSRLQAEVDGTALLQPEKGSPHVSHGIQEKIRKLEARSSDNMHSSQMPAQKLPLTKGMTVNGMVKRLSLERFSPPPTISGPAFSYIRPNEGITYAQLDLNEDQQHQQQRSTLNRRERYFSPARDIRSPEREVPRSNGSLLRKSVDTTDYHTSQNNMRNSSHPQQSSSRVLIEPARDSSYTALGAGPTTIRISSSLSPSPWQQLSPRNLSDEDEGLGIETRKYYHDDELPKRRSKSPAEPPIVPVIRSITPPPRENGYEPNGGYLNGRDLNHKDDLGYRRARLESRILTRRFGDPVSTLERNGYDYQGNKAASPERIYLRSPERDTFDERYRGRRQSAELLDKYSPEHTHVDIITQPNQSTLKSEKTSRYKHTKYYDDGRGGVREVYERETHTDGQGKPQVRESRHRERLDSYATTNGTVERHMLHDYEPKSLDSQLTGTDQYRSSPENMKRYESGGSSYQNGRSSHEEHWHSSLKRDKLQQRSFDKGDSGIENDFRKESFNGDLTTRWRKRSPADERKACESFLKKERRHTEQQHQPPAPRLMPPRKETYVYRERSIDDGSHYDPHLDKYPVATGVKSSTLVRRKDQQSQTPPGQDTLKRNKKLGGFEKVKQLFTGGGGGSGGSAASGRDSAATNGGASSSSGGSSKKENLRVNSAASTSTLPPKDRLKDKYMVKEEEMRSRYSEHRGVNANPTETKATDISMRRRLSTPKASPLLLKRTSSDNAKKASLKKKQQQVESPLAAKPEKTSWFKSLDRRSKSKSKEKLNVTVNGHTENAATSTSSMKRSKAAAAPSVPPKNLRFFGDTDVDSNPPTITRAHTTLKSRPLLTSTLNRSQKYSQSAYNLDRIPSERSSGTPQHSTIDYRRHLSNSGTSTPASAKTNGGVAGSRSKSNSMQNLKNGGDEVDYRKRRHYSRSRDLDDISESGSETEDQQKRPIAASSRTLSRERLDRPHRYEEHGYRRSAERSMPNGGQETRRTPAPYLNGPPKPARSAERRALSASSYARDRDRFPAESSGTEGESSLHSQRSIVYLHATTVGAIPQPYQMRRRSISRDDLSSGKPSKNQPLQPMTRTVSRSVSMLAPWKPKLISEGYEINYSQEQNHAMSTLPRKPHAAPSSNLSNRSGKKMESSRGRREHLKDDLSTTSASKSIMSSGIRNGDARRKFK